jgi:GntR family transcriptional regulator
MDKEKFKQIKIDRPAKETTPAVPLYLQIAESLLDRIETGQLAPGDRLPPERTLSEMLGVTRMTLRRALGMLEAQGLLERRQGDGTYIAQPKIERQADQLVPFTSGMKRRGLLPGAKLVSLEQRPVEASLARELKLPPGAPVYAIQRLRLLNRQPVMLERLILPAERFPGMERFDLAKRSLYEIMETEYGVVVKRARQSLEPVAATSYEAELLGVAPGAPLMLERRTAYDQHGNPVEVGRDLYRGDRFRFVTEMAPLEL